MTQPNVEQSVNAAAPIEGGKSAATAPGDGGKTTTAVSADSGQAATAAPADAGNPASTAFHELTKAYQELAAKNAANLKSAIQALSAVKTPAEFIEVQKKLIKDGVQAAVADSQNIAHLTTAVFTAAFEPVKRRIEAAQKGVLH